MSEMKLNVKRRDVKRIFTYSLSLFSIFNFQFSIARLIKRIPYSVIWFLYELFLDLLTLIGKVFEEDINISLEDFFEKLRKLEK